MLQVKCKLWVWFHIQKYLIGIDKIWALSAWIKNTMAILVLIYICHIEPQVLWSSRQILSIC